MDLRFIAKLWAGIAVALTLASAHAETSAQDQALADKFRRIAQIIPLRLMAQNKVQFGHLNLEALLKVMQGDGVQIEVGGWFYRPEKVISAMQTDRSTAEWSGDVHHGRIRVNRSLFPLNETGAVIGLHEYLGLARFNDKNYQISTRLYLLSLPKASAFQPAEKQALEQNISQVADLGGVTGVGGGGDVTIKERVGVLKADLNRLSRATEANRQRILGDLSDDFTTIDEAHHVDAQTSTAEISEHSRHVDLYDTCQLFLKSSSRVQERAYAAVLRNNPDAVKIMPSLEAMKVWCRKQVTGEP